MSEALTKKLKELKTKFDDALKLAESGQVQEAITCVNIALIASGFISGEFNGKEPIRPKTQATKVPDGSRVIEGVFDGQHMVGDDGKQYLVPPNYASKSKLVEGDMMKLAITMEGAFVYKQIGPIERNRVKARLEVNEDGMWQASDGMHKWKLLTAAVTYFKGQENDEAIILIPSDAPSRWAAVENIVLK